MKPRYKNLRFYRVDTTKAKDIRDKYADSGGKPYFKFYKRGEYIDEVPYMDWSKQEPELKKFLSNHNGGEPEGPTYEVEGDVRELKNVDELEEAFQEAGEHVVAMMYHNGNTQQE